MRLKILGNESIKKEVNLSHAWFLNYMTDYLQTDPYVDEPRLHLARRWSRYVNRFGGLTFDASQAIAGQQQQQQLQQLQQQLLLHNDSSRTVAPAVDGHVVWGAACYSHHVAGASLLLTP